MWWIRSRVRLRADAGRRGDRARARRSQRRRSRLAALQAGAADDRSARLLAMQGDFERGTRAASRARARRSGDAGHGSSAGGHLAARGVDRAARRRPRRPQEERPACRARRASRRSSDRAFYSDRRRSSRAVSSTCRVASTKPESCARSSASARPPTTSSTSSIADAIEGCLPARSEGRHEEAERARTTVPSTRADDDRLLLRTRRRRGSCSPRRCRSPATPARQRRCGRDGLALLDAKGDVDGRCTRARAPRRARHRGRLIAVGGRC